MIKRIGYPLWMLLFVGVAVVRREVVWCVLAGAVGLGAQVIARRAWRTATGHVALANLLTLVRLGLVVALPALFSSMPPALFTPLLLMLLALDGVDGWLARTRGESSAFGATLDMETDALGVMVLSLLLWRELDVGPWVLAAGLWRYVYAAAISLVPSLGECPRSPLYRWLFVLTMLSLSSAFLPWVPLPRPLAALGTLVVSVSFLHSIVRSRAFNRDIIESARP